MPSLIETRPFTLRPETYAWPSYRLFSERAIWIYLALLAGISFLLVVAMSIPVVLAILVGLALVLIAFFLTYQRYRSFLGKPENRQIYQNCVVSLTDDEIRQDFTNGSHMAIKLFAVTQFRELGGLFFVFATRKYGIVIPRTAFESEDDAATFASRLREAAQKK